MNGYVPNEIIGKSPGFFQGIDTSKKTKNSIKKALKNIEPFIEDIKYLLSETPHLHIILQGFPFSHASKFGCFLDRIHFAEKKATKYAMGYKMMKYNSFDKQLQVNSRNEKLPKINSLSLINQNIIARKKQLDSIVAALKKFN